MDDQPKKRNLSNKDFLTVVEPPKDIVDEAQKDVDLEQTSSDSRIDESKSSAPTEVLRSSRQGSEIRFADESTLQRPSESLTEHSDNSSLGQQLVSLLIGNKTFKPFNDRYWIGDELGTGGMGLVYLGWDIQLQRHVAIKLIRHDRKSSKQNAHRFLREARIASRLRHPGILGIHDFSIDTSGTAYIIMDMITGKTMEQVIKDSFEYESKRLAMLNIFLQICQAISFAHANGVVHRDLKPANIMVGDYGLATVLDWGLAKVIGPDGFQDIELRREDDQTNGQPQLLEWIPKSQEKSNTLFGTVMGSPHYLAPEQARGELVDYRADVFSLGGILCHILTGVPPFSGKKLVEVYQQSASGQISHAFELLDRCGAPNLIVNLAKKCLAPDINDRPKTASFLVDTLKEYLESGQRRAEEELVRFFDLSLDLFCIANTQGYFSRLNDNFSRTLGYTNQELTSSPFIDFVHPDDRSETLNELMRISNGEPTIQFKNRYRHRDGHYIWLEWTARAIIAEGIIYAVARDITERVRLETEKLRIESDRFRLSEIVDSAADAIIGKNLDGVVQSWNQGAEKLFGYSAQEIIGKKIHCLIPNDRIDEENIILERIQSGDKVEHFETVRIHKSGELIDVSLSISPIRTPSGNIIGASKIARSIANQRRLESELNRTRKALVDFAENANVPLHCVDQAGTIIWANDAELRFLGYHREEYIGQPIAKFHASQTCINNIFKLLLLGETLSHQCAQLIAKDGSIKDVAIYSSAYHEDGKLVHTRCFTIDLNQLKHHQSTP